MDFKLYKKSWNKATIWFGSVTFGALLITLITLYSLSFSSNSKQLTFVIESCANFILVYIVIFVSFLSKSTNRSFLNETVLKKENTEEIERLYYQKSYFLHIFINIFTITAFFIEITSYGQVAEVSWTQAAKESIVLFIPLYIFNLIYMYLYSSVLIYLLNEDKELIKASLVKYQKPETV